MASRCLLSDRSRLVSVTRRDRRLNQKEGDILQLQAETAQCEVPGRWLTNDRLQARLGQERLKVGSEILCY
ncbi:hypothetical protein TSMEX_001433 [Taenia solium]|eukprot:TsM_000631400 transcript=TsM_000631400 gene=TsM_000631400